MFVYVRAHLFALLAIETAPPTHTHKHQHTHTQTDTKTYANTNTRIDRHTRSRIRRSIPVVSARRNTVRTAPPAPDRCPSLSPGAAAVHGRVAPGRYVCVRVCVCVCARARARVRMSCVGGLLDFSNNPSFSDQIHFQNQNNADEKLRSVSFHNNLVASSNIQN